MADGIVGPGLAGRHGSGRARAPGRVLANRLRRARAGGGDERTPVAHFVDIDGNPVHFLLYEGEHPDALAIVLTHGWPSSFLEMPALAAHLAAPSRHGGDRADAFIGIVPSLPGFAFSPQRASLPAQVPTHQIWHRLMCRSSTNDQRGPSRQGGCLVGEWERTAAALTEYWQPRMLPARVAEIWDRAPPVPVRLAELQSQLRAALHLPQPSPTRAPG
jgi:Epoxide hydrolase N terminus